jgi:hypothetical protein
VLEFLNYERQDPVITFEQVCNGVHRQTAERDTIELFPDGTARRATYVEHWLTGTLIRRRMSLPPEYGSAVLQRSRPTRCSTSTSVLHRGNTCCR